MWCREMVAEAMRAALTKTLEGSRSHTGSADASLGLQAQEKSTPPATMQVAAAPCL